MTGFQRAKEDRRGRAGWQVLTSSSTSPTPPQVYNWRVYMSSLIVATGVMAYGYDSAFIGGH
ncbi:hypothetical protein LTR33_015345 [Friedmanniomyces endolithicus]|nr:hypothetical protein LTR33_015345 [Friedmanniomyces endolithicus]